MKIGIIGYGKMGKTIERLAEAKGHEVLARFDSSSPPSVSQLAGLDVCIEFTSPESAAANILTCFKAQVPVVVGTTAWYHHLEQTRAELKEHNGGLFYASNFSLGVHLFWEANRYLAKIMSEHKNYLCSIHEVHHTEKKDAPSGTAISTAEVLIESNPSLNAWTEALQPEKEQIRITHERLDDVKGTHVVTYDSNMDSIKLEHYAKSRDGFALGAIKAAEFMQNKKGEYTMKDLLNFPQL